MDGIVLFMPFNENVDDYTGNYIINTTQTSFVSGIKNQKQLNISSVQQAYIEKPDFITLNEFSLFFYTDFKNNGNIISFYSDENKFFRLFYEDSFKIEIKKAESTEIINTSISKSNTGFIPISLVFKQFKDYDGALCINVQGKKSFYTLDSTSRFTSSNCVFRFGQHGTPISDFGRNDISIQNFIVFSKQLGENEQQQLITQDYKKTEDITYALNGQQTLRLINIPQLQNLSFVEVFDKDEKNIQLEDRKIYKVIQKPYIPGDNPQNQYYIKNLLYPFWDKDNPIANNGQQWLFWNGNSGPLTSNEYTLSQIDETNDSKINGKGVLFKQNITGRHYEQTKQITGLLQTGKLYAFLSRQRLVAGQSYVEAHISERQWEGYWEYIPPIRTNTEYETHISIKPIGTEPIKYMSIQLNSNGSLNSVHTENLQLYLLNEQLPNQIYNFLGGVANTWCDLNSQNIFTSINGLQKSGIEWIKDLHPFVNSNSDTPVYLDAINGVQQSEAFTEELLVVQRENTYEKDKGIKPYQLNEEDYTKTHSTKDVYIQSQYKNNGQQKYIEFQRSDIFRFENQQYFVSFKTDLQSCDAKQITVYQYKDPQCTQLISTDECYIGTIDYHNYYRHYGKVIKKEEQNFFIIQINFYVEKQTTAKIYDLAIEKNTVSTYSDSLYKLENFIHPVKEDYIVSFILDNHIQLQNYPENKLIHIFTQNFNSKTISYFFKNDNKIYIKNGETTDVFNCQLEKNRYQILFYFKDGKQGIRIYNITSYFPTQSMNILFQKEYAETNLKSFMLSKPNSEYIQIQQKYYNLKILSGSTIIQQEKQLLKDVFLLSKTQ